MFEILWHPETAVRINPIPHSVIESLSMLEVIVPFLDEAVFLGYPPNHFMNQLPKCHH